MEQDLFNGDLQNVSESDEASHEPKGVSQEPRVKGYMLALHALTNVNKRRFCKVRSYKGIKIMYILPVFLKINLGMILYLQTRCLSEF